MCFSTKEMLIFAILKQDETKKKKSMETNKYLCHTKKQTLPTLNVIAPNY